MLKIHLLTTLIFTTLTAESASQKSLNFDLKRYSYIGDLAKVKECLKDGAEIDTKSIDDNMTPLLYAGYKNRKDIVKYLIEKGADKNAISHSGRNLIIYAVQHDELSLTKYLIDHGVNLVSFERDSKDALFVAVKDGNLEIVKYLLPKFKHINRYYYINIDTFDSVKTNLLITAIQNNHIEIAKLLLKHGADINQKNSRGETAVLTAMRKKHYSFAKELLKLRAKSEVVDIGGNTVLSYALHAKQEDIALEVLQNKKFDTFQRLDTTVFSKRAYIYEYYISSTKKEWQFYTYLQMAAYYGMDKAVQKLLDMGMKIDELSNEKGGLSLDALGYASWHGHLESVKLLIKNGANPYTVYENHHPQGENDLAFIAGASKEYTLLSLAMIYQGDDKELVKYLLSLPKASKYKKLMSQKRYENALKYTKAQKKKPKTKRQIFTELSNHAIESINSTQELYELFKKVKNNHQDINKIRELSYHKLATPLLHYISDIYNKPKRELEKSELQKIVNLGANIGSNSQNSIQILNTIYSIYSQRVFTYLTTNALFKAEMDKLYNTTDLTQLILNVYNDRDWYRSRIENILEYAYWHHIDIDTNMLIRKIEDKKIRKLLKYYTRKT